MSDRFENYLQDEEEKSTSGQWLVTFADMSLLMLTFFILLFSLSSMDTRRFGELSEAMREHLGTESVKEGAAGSLPDSMDDAVALDAARLQRELIERQRRVYDSMRTYLNQKNMDGKIGAVFDNGVITLRLPTDVMFESGQVTLTEAAKTALATVRDVLIKQNNQTINIKGYTDDHPPPPSSRFKDNWEISSLRAITVLRYMLDSGIEASRLTATGLADMNPLFPNTTEENRATNRRVEFVLEQKAGL